MLGWMRHESEPDLLFDVMAKSDPVPSTFVDVDGLGRDYGDNTALESLDLKVAIGEGVAFVGQNGSGKTTALSMIAGRLDPTRGTVRIAGKDIHDRQVAISVRSMISFVPDAPALYPDLTVLDHLQIVGFAHGVENVDDRSAELLTRLGLETRSHLLPRELSRGMRQKTQLACALLRPSRVLMLDEPVSGLDQGSRRELFAVLSEAKVGGAAVLLSTHQIDFVDGLVDTVVVLDQGSVAKIGTYGEVMKDGVVRELGLL